MKITFVENEPPKKKFFTWGGFTVKKFFWSDIFFLGLLYGTAMKGDKLDAIVIGIGFLAARLSCIVQELMELNATMKEKTVLDKRTAQWAELYMNHFVPKGKDDGQKQ